MVFGELLETVDDEPVFETGLLLAGDVDPQDIRRQLSRWTGAGRLYQLRRGLYPGFLTGDTRKGYLSWYKCCVSKHLYRKGG